MKGNDHSNQNAKANATESQEGIEKTQSKEPTISRRTILLGTAAARAAAVLPESPSGTVPAAAAQGTTPETQAPGLRMPGKNPFNGVTNLDIRDSKPDWEPFTPERAPEGAPNILVSSMTIPVSRPGRRSAEVSTCRRCKSSLTTG